MTLLKTLLTTLLKTLLNTLLQTLRGPADPRLDHGPWGLGLAAWRWGLGSWHLGLGFGVGLRLEIGAYGFGICPVHDVFCATCYMLCNLGNVCIS